MPAATPLQTVRTQFKTRAELVTATLDLLETDDRDATRSALSGTTNKKLLRIYECAKQVKDQFGGRKNLIEKIKAARFPNGKPDDGYVKRLEESTAKRLLEEYRQVGGK